MADPDADGGADSDARVVEGEVLDSAELDASQPRELETDELPPVVSRLVVEIRSDGRKTMARGAIEDVATGQTVAISADARSLVELSSMLVQSLGQTVGSVLPRIGRRSDGSRGGRLRSAARTARDLLRRRGDE